MTMADSTPLSDDDDLLAAELAFGLLDAVAQAAAEARLPNDPAFAAACRRWQDRAAGLLDGGDEQPRAAVWETIVARLPANDGRGPAVVPRTLLRRWQAATGLATAAAIVLAVMAGERPTAPVPPARPAQPAPLMVAVLRGTGGTAVSVSFDPGGRRMIVAPSGLLVGLHAAELWVIPAGGAPHSLGLIEPAKPRTAPAPAAAGLIAPGATLAISMEPSGGSPTGQPTGPVLVSGKVVQV